MEESACNSRRSAFLLNFQRTKGIKMTQKKISISEQMLIKFNCINGDFEKLKTNPNTDYLITTIKNAFGHIYGILKNIDNEIMELQKKTENLPKDMIL